MNLRREVSNGLVSRGFKRKGRMHLSKIDNDFSFWVDTGPLEKRSDIAPFAGIRHDEVERLLGELLGLPSDKWAGTLGANVGYILGEGYLAWDSPTKPELVLGKIEMALERYRPFLSLEKLINAWDVAGIPDGDRPYRETVILLMLQDVEGVLSQLEKARAIFCKQEGEICDQYRGFEQAVLKELKLISKSGISRK